MPGRRARLRESAKLDEEDLDKEWETFVNYLKSDRHRQFPPQSDLRAWWRKREDLPAVQRLLEFFSDMVLPNTDGPVVVFCDDIDSTISLRFKDDFFAAIRGCYNARASEPLWRRLSFVLLGTASPSDLISDPRVTPFNIGRRVELTDFTFEEARQLAAGLAADKTEQERQLRRVL